MERRRTRPLGMPTVFDGQVPCSEWDRQRVRLETEQPIYFVQVPWIAWPSKTAGPLKRVEPASPPAEDVVGGELVTCATAL